MPPTKYILIGLHTILLLCDICQAHGGYHAQIRQCDEELQRNPNNAEIWFQRSRLNYLHGDWEKSLADLDQAESLAPGKYPVKLARGQALMAGGKLEAAKLALDEFIKSDTNVAEAYNSRALLLMKLESPSAAATDYQKAIELKTTPEPDDYIAWANAFMLSGKPEQALQSIETGLSRLGVLPALANKAIEIEVSLQHYDAALERALVQQKAAARPEQWMAKRASILAEAGRLKQSRDAWKALRVHLLALPAAQRDSHAMSRLFEQTNIALQALASTPPEQTQ